MTTMSISIDDETKKDIDRLARAARKSRSDIVRELFVRYRLEQNLEAMEATAAPLLESLGLNSEDDIASYAKH